MALRQLILRNKIAAARSRLDGLRGKDAEFEARAARLQTREAELEAALGETTPETPDEDRKVLEAEVEAHEEEQQKLTDEQAAHDKEKGGLETEIAQLEQELRELDERAAAPAKPAEERKEDFGMNTRSAFWKDWAPERRAAFFQREDVGGFLEQVRGCKGQKRAVVGGGLTIPDVMLGMLRDNLHRYSKLYKHVNVRSIKGAARQNILGAAPEAVWMEAAGSLNELSFAINQVEVDGFMVGGFIAIADALLEDSDENLAAEILDMLGQSIGLAVDKAILYGTGEKMPVGIVTRLAMTAASAGWGKNAPAFTDLHASHLLHASKADLTDANFFKELVAACGKAKANYSTGAKFWAMNSNTQAKLLGKALTFNAAGAIVAQQMNAMPIVGGPVEILEFMPDDVIVGGYGSLYLVAERSGAKLEQSEHVRFLQNQTVFRGVARYDGKPVFGEGFIAFSLGATPPAADAVTFAEDAANKPDAPTA